MANRRQRSGCCDMTSAVLASAVVLVLGLVGTYSARAQTFTDLYNFTGSPDGGYPQAGLTRDSAGSLYGTTTVGGSSNQGTVFKLNASGQETVLYSFTGGSDGGYPYTGLIRDTKGNLFGTTTSGGVNSQGVVFKVSKTNTETVLYKFAGGTTDGCYPYQGLVQDKTGNLYGTTSTCGSANVGTVFKINKAGKEVVLHSFVGGSSDGAYPYYGSLLMDKEENLYGVAQEGGAFNQGVVYKLSKKGIFTVLHSFAGGTTDGCLPFGTVAMDKAGNLYGTTEVCGTSVYGIVWKLNKKGTETVLHNFSGEVSDGAEPFSGVIMDATGNLYGNTSAGGSSGGGTVYKLNKKGTLTLLHSFARSDGTLPSGEVIRDAKGNLYGTAFWQGGDAWGTVWKLTP